MISVTLTVSRFEDGKQSATTLAQIQLKGEAGPHPGMETFQYEGKLEQRLSAPIKIEGGGYDRGHEFQQASLAVFVGGKQLANMGGFFSRVPLTISLYAESIDVWLEIHVATAED